MMNGTKERKDCSLLASPQPGIQRNGLEKYENSLPLTVRTVQMVYSGPLPQNNAFSVY